MPPPLPPDPHSPSFTIYLPRSPEAGGEAATEELSPELYTYGLRLYLEAWAAYVEADCPLGEAEEAMYLWYIFNQQGAEDGSWTFCN